MNSKNTKIFSHYKKKYNIKTIDWDLIIMILSIIGLSALGFWLGYKDIF